jgi:cyd operon protein YbgT
MWYFSWILGVGLAVGFGILNGVWHEFHSKPEHDQILPEPTK